MELLSQSWLKAALIAVLTIMISSFALAGSPVQVTPVQFVIDKGRPIVSMTIKSSGDERQLFQVDLRRWQVVDGEAQLSPAQTVRIVTPPLCEFNAGETQIVRLGLTNPVDTTEQEQTWRGILRDITPKPDSGGSTMFVRMNISMPVFVPADNPLPLAIATQATWQDNSNLLLTCENQGNRHGHIVNATLLDANGDAVVSRGLSHYVLPGESNRTLVTFPTEDDDQAAALRAATHISLTVRNHVSKEVTDIVVPLGHK